MVKRKTSRVGNSTKKNRRFLLISREFIGALNTALQETVVLQIGQTPIGTGPPQGFGIDATGRNRRASGANGPGAGNICRRIPHHQDLVIGQRTTHGSRSPATGTAGNFRPILVIIAKATEGEFLPKVVSAKLQFSTQANIASQQSDQRWLRQGTESGETARHTRTNLSLVGGKVMVQPEKVGIEEPEPFPGSIHDPMGTQKIPNQAGIRGAVKSQVCGPGRLPVHVFRHAGKRLHPRTTRANQRAIDIKQDQANHWPEERGTPPPICQSRLPERQDTAVDIEGIRDQAGVGQNGPGVVTVIRSNEFSPSVRPQFRPVTGGVSLGGRWPVRGYFDLRSAPDLVWRFR